MIVNKRLQLKRRKKLLKLNNLPNSKKREKQLFKLLLYKIKSRLKNPKNRKWRK